MQRAERLAEVLFGRQNALKHLNAFISTPSQASVAAALDGPYGKRPQLEQSLIAVKDNICTADFPTTCGSRGLDGFQSPYDATVVDRLKRAGALISGKTNLDEFGMGSHSTHSAYGPVQTVSGRSAGGSSGGSAVAVATGQCHAALGTDTGGSVRLPAAFTGVYGFKPSYGLVSRWGVVAYANSLDTVGFIARHPMSIKNLFDVCNAYDDKDPTSILPSTRQRIHEQLSTRGQRRSLRFGIPRECNTVELSPQIRQAWLSTLKALQAEGHTVHEVSLPSIESALSAYYVLAPAEASSNLAKYDGVRYGSASSSEAAAWSGSGVLYAKTRQHGFGPEVRRRILLGAYSLSASAIDNYFLHAQRVRRLLKQEYDGVFAFRNVASNQSSMTEDGVDALICPTAPNLPPSLDELKTLSSLDAYAGDVFTVPASLAGLPAMSVPVSIASSGDVDSVGIQIITQFGDDDRAIFIADLLNDLGVCKPLGA